MDDEEYDRLKINTDDEEYARLKNNMLLHDESDLSSDTSSKYARVNRVMLSKNSPEYRQRRERNNAAVKKSRFKSKQKTLETQERVDQLKNENGALERKVDTLSKELDFMRNIFSAKRENSISPTESLLAMYKPTAMRETINENHHHINLHNTTNDNNNNISSLSCGQPAQQQLQQQFHTHNKIQQHLTNFHQFHKP